MAYCIYWFLYFCLSPLLSGQTIGMAIVGIKLVNADTGADISACRVLLRTALLPLTLQLLHLVRIGTCRRDGRMLHDLVARTGLVYKWNARLTSMQSVPCNAWNAKNKLKQQPFGLKYPRGVMTRRRRRHHALERRLNGLLCSLHATTISDTKRC